MSNRVDRIDFIAVQKSNLGSLYEIKEFQSQVFARFHYHFIIITRQEIPFIYVRYPLDGTQDSIQED